MKVLLEIESARVAMAKFLLARHEHAKDLLAFVVVEHEEKVGRVEQFKMKPNLTAPMCKATEALCTAQKLLDTSVLSTEIKEKCRAVLEDGTKLFDEKSKLIAAGWTLYWRRRPPQIVRKINNRLSIAKNVIKSLECSLYVQEKNKH